MKKTTCSEILGLAGPLRKEVEHLLARTSATHLALVLASPELKGGCLVGDGPFALVAVGPRCKYRDIEELRRGYVVERRTRTPMIPAAYCDLAMAETATEARIHPLPASSPSLSERMRLLTGLDTEIDVRLQAAEGLAEQLRTAGISMRSRVLPSLRKALLRFDEAAPAVRTLYQQAAAWTSSTSAIVTAEDHKALERVEAEQDRYFRSHGEYDDFSGFKALLRSRKPGRRLLGARALYDIVGCEGPGGDQTVYLRDELIKALLVEPVSEIRLTMLATLTSQSGYYDDPFAEGLASDGLLFRMLIGDVDKEVALAAAPFLVGQEIGDPEGCDQVLFEVLVCLARHAGSGPWSASPEMRSAVLAAMAKPPNGIPPRLLERWAPVVEWMAKADPAKAVRKAARAGLEELERWQVRRKAA